MNLSICTISFRHQLISIDELADWAAAHQFQGIELWGVHARNLYASSQYDRAWLQDYGLRVPMISDYLPLEGAEANALAKADELCGLARHWGAKKIRTFAGNQGSAGTSVVERRRLTARLRNLADLVHQAGLQLLVETHPHTLADTTASTLDLLSEVDHPGLAINFDVLHVWESGDDPLQSRLRLLPHIAHYHLKNILSRRLLHVFAPPNVYAASGNRDGMVPLFEGEFDYQGFLADILAESELDASLEWFGDDVKKVLHQDQKQIRLLEKEVESGAAATRRMAAAV